MTNAKKSMSEIIRLKGVFGISFISQSSDVFSASVIYS